MHSKRNRLITFVLVVSSWQLIDYLFDIRKIILPTPIEIFSILVNNFSYLLYHTMITMVESFSGFILGSALGLLSAIIFTYSKTLKSSLYPYAVAFKAVPVIAIAPLLIMWFGSGMTSKIIMAAIICYFPPLVGGVKGFSAVTRDHLDLFKSMSATGWDVFWKLRLPASLSHIFPSLKISATFAVLGATLAEFTGASMGIGYIIVNSSYYLETTMMFAAIVMISIVGLMFFYVVDYVEKKVVFW
jgi:NitT/TauT family transport system permease protein